MRRLTPAILLLACAWIFLRPALPRGARFDPLGPSGRQVERAIEEQRFADALPLVRELSRQYQDQPVVAYWTAEVYRGLRRFSDEAAALERLRGSGGEPDAYCPALPEAYTNAGDLPHALDAYVRCAVAAEKDPERWLDLAAAYDSRGQRREAAQARAHARVLAPFHPAFAGVPPDTDGEAQ